MDPVVPARRPWAGLHDALDVPGARVRYFPKRADRNQKAIAAALKAAGCTVQSLHTVGGGCPDLLVGRHGETWLIEIKTPEEAARLARGTSHNRATAVKQAEWAKAWRGAPPLVASTPEQALDALGLREKPVSSGVERFYDGR